MLSKISDFVKDALHRKVANQRASEAVVWGAINCVVFSILIYDLINDGWSHTSAISFWTTCAICTICTLNILIHLKAYITVMFSIKPLEVTDKQRKLLSVSDSDIGFKSPTPKIKSLEPEKLNVSPKLSTLFEASRRSSTPQRIQNTSLNSPNQSWLTNSPPQDKFATSNSSMFSNTSFMNMSQGANTSGSPSVSANSWIFHRNQSSLLDSSYNIINSPDRNTFNPPQLAESFLNGSTSPPFGNRLGSQATSSPLMISSQQRITSKKDLDSYLEEFRVKERKRQILSQSDTGNSGSNYLWAYNSTNNEQDVLNTLKNNVYQLAVKDENLETHSSSNKNDNFKVDNLSSSTVSKIWLKRQVTPKMLFQFEENMRIWLSSNILQPLVTRIDDTNESIAIMAPELQIGNVGLDKLRKAAQNMSGIKQLSNLMPFIDFTIHQDYLVKRLKELSRGGAISAFKWNGGGNFNGKSWRDEYPTDSYILLHLFALYMDNHLPPDPTHPDGRVFSNVHIVKTPEKPTKPATNPYLYLTQVNPPHLIVVLPGEEECDVGGGHKNLFHSLLLFCHFIVHQQHSHIAGVNLNLSGINLAWVLNSK